MRPQFGRIREVVQAFGIPIYEKDGFEADDVLGTLAAQATQQGVESIIYTGDMDTLQLVNKHVTVKVAKRGITEITEYDESAVQARYGIAPEKIPDFKGLVGDKSDNIPGVPGIGEKTASKLIADYGSLEGILAHLDELKPKEQKLIGENIEQAKESKFLATIVLDVPVQLDLEDCRIDHLNRGKILAIFRELEFRTMVERMLALFRDLGIAAQDEDTSPAPTHAAASGFAQAVDKQNAANGNERDMAAAASSPAVRKTQEPVPEQDEDLLLAPPLGMVPILTPPPPPDSPGPGIQFITPGKIEDEDALNRDPTTPVQLDLFEMNEATPAVVRKLRLPSVSRDPQEAPLQLIEEGSTKKTSTLIVNSEEALQVLIKSMHDAGKFAFDTETTSEDPWHADLVGISCSMAPGEAYYIPVGHIQTIDNQDPGTQLPLAHVLEKLDPLIEDAGIQKYMHNAKYDMLILARYGIKVRGLAFDTMVGAYLTDPGRRGLGLKDQAFQRLGIVMTPISELIGTGSKMISMAQVPIRFAADYAGADADMTLRLVETIRDGLGRHNLLDLYNSIELPLTPVLLQMELYGVALDAGFLSELDKKLSEQIRALEKEIYASVGHQFNINSNRQLGDILFGELKLPSGKKTKTGYSVSAHAIEGLRGKHPMVDSLLEYRQLTKLKSTYVDGLLALMDPVTGQIGR